MNVNISSWVIHEICLCKISASTVDVWGSEWDFKRSGVAFSEIKPFGFVMFQEIGEVTIEGYIGKNRKQWEVKKRFNFG